MVLMQQIQSDLKTAYKQKNSAQLDALKYIMAQIKDAQIDKQAELSDEEINKLLQKEIKKRLDAIKIFADAGRNTLVKEEKEKLIFLSKYAPKQLSEDELLDIVKKTLQANPSENSNFGLMMKKIMAQTDGKADGSLVAKILKDKLVS